MVSSSRPGSLTSDYRPLAYRLLTSALCAQSGILSALGHASFCLAASISSQNFGFCCSASSSCTFKPGPEQEILERVAVEDAVDHQAQFVPLEIDAVIPDPEPVQRPAGALEFAELVQLGAHHLLRQAAELAQDLELQLFGHPRQFRRAGRVEDDLKWAHCLSVAALGPHATWTGPASKTNQQ